MRTYRVTVRKTQKIIYEVEAESLSQVLNHYASTKPLEEGPLEVVGLDIVSGDGPPDRFQL